MHGLVTILCRMVTVNLETSKVVELFKDYGLPLEVLGVDLLNIFKTGITSRLYVDALVIDLFEMICKTDVSFDFIDVKEDLHSLLKEIDYQMSSILVRNARIVNIQLQGRDTLILEYVKCQAK